MGHQRALAIPQILATSDGVKALYGLERLAVLEGGAWHYPQHDALGSVRQWTDAAAAVLAMQSYSPSRCVTATPNACSPPKRRQDP